MAQAGGTQPENLPAALALNEELSDYRLVEPKDIVPWELGTGPAVKDWLARRSA
jgi:NAD+ diphosphatase